MSGEPYSQRSGLINLSNERIFQVMNPSACHIVILPHIILLYPHLAMV